MWELLSNPDVQKGIGAVIAATVSSTLVITHRVILLWAIDKYKKIKASIDNSNKNAKKVKRTVDIDVQIGDKLVTLMTLMHADRAYVFQFENGTQFTSGHCRFWISNTHEKCRAGIESFLLRLQRLPSAIVAGSLSTLWGKAVHPGVNIICPAECKLFGVCRRKHYRFNVSLLDTASATLARERGIDHMIYWPLLSNDEEALIGFVGVDYCSDRSDAELDLQERIGSACPIVTDINYKLLNNNI